MLDITTAKKIGFEFCVNALGVDFVNAHRETSTFGFGEDDGYVFCFVGVDDVPRLLPNLAGGLLLDSVSKFPYHASCAVDLEDGEVMTLECIAPRKE